MSPLLGGYAGSPFESDNPANLTDKLIASFEVSLGHVRWDRRVGSSCHAS